MKTLGPAERVKQMIVQLDTAVSENAAIMSKLATQLQEIGVAYRVSDLQPPGSVRWKRKTQSEGECVGEGAEVGHGYHTDKVAMELSSQQVHSREHEETHLIVTLEGVGFLGLVHYTRQVSPSMLY